MDIGGFKERIKNMTVFELAEEIVRLDEWRENIYMNDSLTAHDWEEIDQITQAIRLAKLRFDDLGGNVNEV